MVTRKQPVGEDQTTRERRRTQHRVEWNNNHDYTAVLINNTDKGWIGICPSPTPGRHDRNVTMKTVTTLS